MDVVERSPQKEAGPSLISTKVFENGAPPRTGTEWRWVSGTGGLVNGRPTKTELILSTNLDASCK